MVHVSEQDGHLERDVQRLSFWPVLATSEHDKDRTLEYEKGDGRTDAHNHGPAVGTASCRHDSSLRIYNLLYDECVADGDEEQRDDADGDLPQPRQDVFREVRVQIFAVAHQTSIIVVYRPTRPEDVQILCDIIQY